MDKKVLGIIEESKKKHCTKNGLFLEKYLSYYDMEVRDNYILYESFNGQGIIDNPYGLFKAFMKRKDFKDYIHIWVVDSYGDKWFQIMEYSQYPNVKYVQYGSDDYLKYISISKYLINNCTFPSYFIKKKDQVYINTWHGETIKHLGYDVPNSKLSLANTIRNFLSADYILSSSSHMTDVYLNSYKLDGIYNGKIIQEGQPRTDFNFSNREYVIEKLKSFGIEIDKNKKIILYAPTWTGTLDNPGKVNWKEISDIVDTTKYQILFKPHHVLYKKDKSNIPSAMDTNELLTICDVLITDYSSIAFDFMNMNKPVIFYLPRDEEYKRTQGLYFEWSQNVAYDINTLKVYLQHLDLIKTQFVPANVCGDKILSIIFDNAPGNIITCKNNKIKLLFYVGDLKPNGVTTSFMSLVNFIDYNKFDVSLIVLNKKDINYSNFVESIPSQVRVLCRAGTYAETLLEGCAKDITLQLGIGTDYLKNLFPKTLYEREFRRCFGLSTFDKLINFTGYSPFYSYLFMCSDCGEKIVWLHNDMVADQNRIVGNKKPLYSTLKAVFTTYQYYDRLISASKEIMKVNMKNFPNIPRSKFYYAHNTLNYEKILQLSKINNGTTIDKSKVNFINVARLSYAKNQVVLISAFNKFAEKYPNCELYIAGDGELKDELNKIKGNHIHLLGYQSNPYWTMAQCDCFIFPSIYEGQGISLLEARVLGLPIIVSDLPKMKGIFIKKGQYNIRGFSEEDIIKGLEAYMNNKVPYSNFDYKQYNNNSYKEFEVAICE